MTKTKTVAERNALVMQLEPLMSALDNQLWQTDNFGRERPSTYAGPIVYTLGGICQNVWRQLYGDLGQVPNATDRLEEARQAMQNRAEKFGNDTDSRDVDPIFLRAFERYHMLAVTVESLEALLQYCEDAYTHATGKQWEPLTQPVAKNTASPMKKFDKQAIAAAMAAKA